MDQESIRDHVAEECPGTHIIIATDGLPAGDTFFIYDPNGDLPDRQQIPFATIVTKDYGDFDNASNLDREGVFRLNVGVSRRTFQALFPEAGAHDFTAVDRLMPHPVYGPQWWLCVVNPSDATFERVKPLLREAYEAAAARLTRRGG